MGCGGSKVDNLPLVIRCRERKEFIKEASYQRYALAAAHLSYFQSLGDVGEAIRRFVDEELVFSPSPSLSPSSSPVLTLPSEKGKKSMNHRSPKSRKPKSASSSTSISHSVSDENYGGRKKHKMEDDDFHLHLSSDSGLDTDSGSGSELHAGHIHIEPSPGHFHTREEEVMAEEEEPPPESFPYPYPYGYGGYGYNSYEYPAGGWGPPGGNSGMYYMKRTGPPSQSVIYEEPGNHRVVENRQWPVPGNETAGYGYYGYPPAPQRTPPPAESKPLPSPPRVPQWDYLNFFDSFDYNGGYFPQSQFAMGSTTSSPDSKEVREREGIPELEDETENEPVNNKTNKVKKKKKSNYKGETRFNRESGEDTYEQVKETHKVKGKKANFKGEGRVNRDSGEGTSRTMPPPLKISSEEDSSSSKVALSSLPSDDSIVFSSGHDKECITSGSSNCNETVEAKSLEEEPVKKKAVSFEVGDGSNLDLESSKMSSLTTLSVHGTRDLSEAVQEVKVEFEVASTYGKEVAMLLEVSKLPYERQYTPLKVILSRISYLVTHYKLSSRLPPRPSIRLTSRMKKMAKAYNGEASGNISSTLEKLYAWEKKLYKEVRDEEKLRVLYEVNCKRLKRLDQEGAESTKIDATRAIIRKLLTKIDICIRSVDVISRRIHKLRDEELQPQLTQLIYGLIRMWRSMLKCHQKQFQAIMESKVRALKAKVSLRQDSGLKATLDLEIELREWSTRFNNWITTQKSYVESLNEWLSRCLLYEPEKTADGVAPFSPSKIGAPPIFVICNDWHEAMVRISGDEVANAMQGFASNLHELWEKQEEERRQRVKADYISKDSEKQLDIKRGKTEHDQDAMSEKTIVSKSTGVSPLDDLTVDLDLMSKKLAEQRAKHKEVVKLVRTAASSSLQSGLLPIFGALGNFTSEVVKGHEQVRLQSGQNY